MNTFQSAFATRLTTYVRLRRQLGLRFKGQEAVLHTFDRYAQEHDHQGPLTEQFARAFAFSGVDPATDTPARRYLVVRHFAEYLATYNPSTPDLIPRPFACAASNRPPTFLRSRRSLNSWLRPLGFPGAIPFRMCHCAS